MALNTFEPVQLSTFGYTSQLSYQESDDEWSEEVAEKLSSQEYSTFSKSPREEEYLQSFTDTPISMDVQKSLANQKDPISKSLTGESKSHEHIKIKDIVQKHSEKDEKNGIVKSAFNQKNDEHEKEERRVRSFTSVFKQTEVHEKGKSSTPDFVKRRHLTDRRLSFEPNDRLRALVEQRIQSNNRLSKNDPFGKTDSALDVNENETKSKLSKSRFMNSFRKKSVSKKKSVNNSNLLDSEKTLHLNESDILAQERDRAIEEWGRATIQCEELITDLEATLSELITTKLERDEKEEEIQDLLIRYENDLIDRDNEIDRLHERFEETSEELHVIRTERREAYEQRDELLRQAYESSQDIENLQKEVDDLEEEKRNLCQNLIAVEDQMQFLRKERDHALHLWNESVEERKKLHDVQKALSQARDDSLRKTFEQLEEINNLRNEKDKLRINIENIRRCIEKNSDEHLHCECLNRHASKLNSPCSEDDNARSIDANILEENDLTMLFSSKDEFEEIVIGIDALDSRMGLKLDDAIDAPHVMVVSVTSQLAEKWNIKKYDRILNVNGTSVVHADKKTVIRLFKETVGRTISVVLHREKPSNNDQVDIDVLIEKQLDLGLHFLLQIYDVKPNSLGVSNLKNGDVITKINSQNMTDIISLTLRKISKRTNGKLSLRVKRKGGFDEDALRSIQNEEIIPIKTKQSITNILSSRKRSGTDLSSPRSLFSDISSLFAVAMDSKSVLESPRGTLTRPGLFKQLSGIEQRNVFELNESPKRRPKSLDLNESDLLQSSNERNMVHETKDIQIITDGFQQYSELSSKPRPSPRLQRSVSSKVLRKKLQRDNSSHLTVDSFNDSYSKVSSNDFVVDMTNEDSARILQRRLPVYATLPRTYKRKTQDDSSKHSTRVLRMEKNRNDKLGFTIGGGNRIGIFVSDLLPGSIAERVGLKIGDRILHLNSTDLTKATLDLATRTLLDHRHCELLRVEVKYNPGYKDFIKDKPLESLYVRCLMSYKAKKDGELSFELGDVFHITNTLHNFDHEKLVWNWYGRPIEKNAIVKSEGILPRIESYIEKVRLPSPQILPRIKPVTNDDLLDKTQKRLQRISKSAHDLKKWISKQPSTLKSATLGRRKRDDGPKEDRTFSFNDLRRNVFYEVLLEEPLSV